MTSGPPANPPITPVSNSPAPRSGGAWRAPGAWRWPLVVLLAGWSVSGWVYHLLQRDRLRREEEFFGERVAEAQAAIRVRMTAYVDALRGGTSFFHASKSVDREEWRVYTESLQLKNRYPGINGLGVVLVVPPDRVEAWKARVRADGETNPEIAPFPTTKAGPPGEPAYLITYVEGNVGEKLPIGRNIATEPSRRRAADLARDTGEPQINRRIPGSRDTQRRSGLLLYVPLYAKDAPVDTLEQRRAAHLGWIYAQVFPDVFLDGVLGPMGKILRLHCFEAGDLNRESLVYASEDSEGASLPAFERVTVMEMAGQPFQLGWRRGPKFPAVEQSPAVWVASSLALATFLLAGLVVSLQNTGHRANEIALERTGELAASEERFRNAFDYAGSGMALVALNGRWLRVNNALCAIVGYTQEELLTKTIADLTHPEDLASDRALMEELLDGRRSFYEMEKRYLHRDGHVRWVRLTTSLVRDAEGHPLHGVIQVENVTTRKAAEAARDESRQMFQRLFESSPDAIVLVDRSGVISRANNRAEQLFGWADGTLSGQRMEHVLPERVRARHAIHLAEYFANPRQRAMGGGFELFGLRRDGREFPVDITLSPVDTSAGTLTLAVVRDITERKRLEATLASARDEALAASKLKSEFLASMSHEIRTPMNAIIGMTGLLVDTPLPAEQREMLTVVQSSAESLMTIINDILDFSKIEAGKLRLEPADFDLRRVVEDTAALFAMSARSHGIAFHSTIALGPQLLLRGDAGRIRQVLTNLIGNALKFTDRGEVAVEAGIVDATPESVKVRIAVRDTGVGIAREVQRKLFQPFVQSGPAGQGHLTGTGLGLAISKQLLDLMGGEIGLQSELGKGSTFWFALELPRVTREANRPLGSFAHLRVLMVEDDPIDRELIGHELANLGVQVTTETDGRAAVATLRRKAAEGEPFHLVMLDWQLPGMNAVDVATEIHATDAIARTPLILVSGGSLANPDIATAVGFEALFNKPVSAEQLERCFARIPRDASPPSAAPAPAVTGPSRRLRLLMAEDNPASQAVGRLLLNKMGHMVDIAENGEVALARLGVQKYDAVLMDCRMPVLDGYETTRRIRSGAVPGVNARVPIIAVTAYAMKEDRARCLAVGMDDYISKPVRPAELSAALERCGLDGNERSEPVAAASTTVLDEPTLDIARKLPGPRGGSLLPEMVATYLTAEADALKSLASAVQQGDLPGIAERAHAFAGRASSLGGFAVRDVALSLEKAARAGDTPAVRMRFGLLQMEAARLRDALNGLKAAP